MYRNGKENGHKDDGTNLVVMLRGDVRVGKTSLILRYSDEFFATGTNSSSSSSSSSFNNVEPEVDVNDRGERGANANTTAATMNRQSSGRLSRLVDNKRNGNGNTRNGSASTTNNNEDVRAAIDVQWGSRDCATRSELIDGYRVNLKIKDQPPLDYYRAYAGHPYRSAHGIILVFDVTDESTFYHIYDWFVEVERYARKDVSIVIVGTKCDSNQRVISMDQAQDFAQSLGVPYIECSSKTGLNVREAFLVVTLRILAHQPEWGMSSFFHSDSRLLRVGSTPPLIRLQSQIIAKPVSSSSLLEYSYYSTSSSSFLSKVSAKLGFKKKKLIRENILGSNSSFSYYERLKTDIKYYRVDFIEAADRNRMKYLYISESLSDTEKDKENEEKHDVPRPRLWSFSKTKGKKPMILSEEGKDESRLPSYQPSLPSSKSMLESLPFEIIERIVVMLDIQSLCNFASTCHYLFNTISTEESSFSIWRALLYRDFPHAFPHMSLTQITAYIRPLFFPPLLHSYIYIWPYSETPFKDIQKKNLPSKLWRLLYSMMYIRQQLSSLTLAKLFLINPMVENERENKNRIWELLIKDKAEVINMPTDLQGSIS